MSNNTSAIIQECETFNPTNYPNAMQELSALNQAISDIPVYYKVEIIVSFLKDHSLKTVWLNANPALARMMTSGFFKTSHLESLFESCRKNKDFLNSLEHYISRLLLKANA